MRFWLFLLGCMGSRTLLTWIAATSSGCVLRALGVLALGPVLGWLYILFIGRRDTGIEVFGDRIWWNHLRPLHLLLWGFFAYLAIVHQHPYAWIALAVDTVLGGGAFLLHHASEGNLRVMVGRLSTP
jgi:hypothetical protein